MRAAHTTLLGLAAVALSAPAVHGVTLEHLITSGDPLISGDKIFTNFFATPTGFGTFDPASVEVTAVVIGGHVGLRFSSVQPGLPIIVAGPGSFMDVLFGFDVTATDPGWTISQLDLSFEASAPGDGFAQIVETALDGTEVVGQMQVQTQPLVTSASMSFLPDTYTTLHVVKDALLLGGSQEPTAIMSFEQTFVQIPEPAALSLLALGGLLFLRHRRSGRIGTPLVAILAVAGMAFMSHSAQAVLLKDLIDDNDTITHGGMLFSDFSFSIDSASGRWIADSEALDVSEVTLGSEDGLRFAGAIAAFSNLTPLSEVTVTIGYRVEILDPGLWFDNASLSFNGAITAPDAIATVSESLHSGILVGALNVSAPAPLSDDTPLGGMHTSLDVVKTITVDGGQSGVGSISFIHQTFSVIPEPASALLLAVGAAGLLRRRRI
jgi:hypothetical protein